jgi:SAM-dependent methyltransferase
MAVSRELLTNLVCPWHGVPLSESGPDLTCGHGHIFPVIEGIPVILDDSPRTLWVADSSLALARRQKQDPATDPYYIETLGICDEERAALKDLLGQPAQHVDPVVSFLVGATNGNAYTHLIGKLREYPIPKLRLPPGNGQTLLDIGCNWGRWSIAAARLGYKPIGLDPSLGAVLAGKRLAAQLGLDAHFVVGDARYLPLRGASIDVALSYSVLQHFAKDAALRAIEEIARTLVKGGRTLIQMPTVFGLRCLYHQARRGFREPEEFNVRYWSLPELRRAFNRYVGPTKFSVDCFFGIGLQAADIPMMPPLNRAVIRVSEVLRKTSRFLPVLCYAADSIYVESIRTAPV